MSFFPHREDPGRQRGRLSQRCAVEKQTGGGAGQVALSLSGVDENGGGEPFLFGPWATLAGWQATLMESYVTGPIKTQARTATRAGRNPDVFAEMNSWIYQTYARLLQNLCGGFMRNGKFDRRVAQEISRRKKAAAPSQLHEGVPVARALLQFPGLTRLKP